MNNEILNVENIRKGGGATNVMVGEKPEPGKELNRPYNGGKIALTPESIWQIQNYTVPKIMEGLNDLFGEMKRRREETGRDENFVIGMYSHSKSPEAQETLSTISSSCEPEIKKLGLDLDVVDIDNYESIEAMGRKIGEKERESGKKKNILIIGDRNRQGLGLEEWTEENKKKAVDIYNDSIRAHNKKVDTDGEGTKLPELDPKSKNFESDLYKKWVDDKEQLTVDLLGIPSVMAMQFIYVIKQDYIKMKKAFAGTGKDKNIRLVYVADSPIMSYAIQKMASKLTSGKVGIGSRGFDRMGGMTKGGEKCEFDFDENGEVVRINYRGTDITKDGFVK